MKLFDRSVNLAQFPVRSSLYPVCRAWMANDPNGAAAPPPVKVEPKDEPADGDLVYQLPPPLYPPLDERGQPANLRVPTGLRPPDPAQLGELHPSKVSAEDGRRGEVVWSAGAGTTGRYRVCGGLGTMFVTWSLPSLSLKRDWVV